MDGKPPSRRLRILALDPGFATRLETAAINEVTVEIQWEEGLRAGPIGEYIEVIDVDPASGMFYHPVDLNSPHLLAQDGLAPSESNPQFHQQMVYAVAMTTIRHFERALGRKAFWADHRVPKARGRWDDQFVRRLRIYPHAHRDQNAYYSPAKKALLFGYFPVTRKDEDNTPGTIVFTCLSHDIIAHEVTHALLDGVHPRFNESTNFDVLAFHEAFADIVSLFQHFTYPAVLESQIKRTRGSLDSESLLAQLAHQFGKSTGRGSALRDALGKVNDQGKWVARNPDPHALETTLGPHDRGAILVAAIFRAFILIYRAKTADLYRIATQGTGRLPDGDIHPDLTKRLASEASWAADRILQMCIRAIDYCPPVDITFGDFLRAVITADYDYTPVDKAGFRIVFIESFREWGIVPRGVRSMGLDALVWPTGDDVLRRDAPAIISAAKKAAMHTKFEGFVRQTIQQWNLENDRFKVWNQLDDLRGALHTWLLGGDGFGSNYAALFGIIIDPKDAPPSVYRKDSVPTFEVHSARPTLRRTLDGSVLTDLVIEITQRRRGYFQESTQDKVDAGDRINVSRLAEPDFIYRAGCTVLVDLRTAEVRRIIRTPGTIASDDELNRLRAFLVGDSGVVGNAFDAGLPLSLRDQTPEDRDEPFALLHQMEE